jgi:phage terminase large subunit-like protein
VAYQADQRCRENRAPLNFKAFGQTGNVYQAAKNAGIHRTTHYVWLKEDPDYAEAFGWTRERNFTGTICQSVR